MNKPNPYRAPASTFEESTESGALTATTPRLASRWSRLFAKLLDTAALFVIIGVAAIVAVICEELMIDEETSIVIAVAVGLLGGLGLLIYNLSRLQSHGQTLGKQVFNIRIVRANSFRPVSLTRLVGLRYLPIYLGSNVPLIGGFLGLFDVLMIFAKDRRCLHDHIADTTVIDYRDDHQLLSPNGPGPAAW
ncbi:MAG: RDD family protein [Persicimonas sp.]